MDSVRISAWYLPVIEFAGLATTAVVVGVGGWLVHQGEVSLGTIAFFVLTLANLFEPVQQLTQLFNTVQSAGAGLNKLFELLDTRSRRARAAGAVDLPDQARSRSRTSRSRIRVDERVGAAATSSWRSRPGSGSRSSARPARASRRWPSSIARLYDPQRGSVTFGGVDLRDAHAVVRCASGSSSCRRRASSSTARSATTCASLEPTRPTPRSTPRCASSVRTSGSRAARGLDTEVRERGQRLSAGEKQLVSLARAALADPAVLVLDEATSTLDPGTEALVEQAMDRLMDGRTVDRHRPPAVDRRAGRPRRRRRRRRPGRARHARRAGRPGRPLRRALRQLGGVGRLIGPR